MGRDDVAGMDFGERHWTIVRLGDLHGAAEHDGDQSIGVAVDWTADIHHQPGGDVHVVTDAGDAARLANRGWWAVVATHGGISRSGYSRTPRRGPLDPDLERLAAGVGAAQIGAGAIEQQCCAGRG